MRARTTCSILCFIATAAAACLETTAQAPTEARGGSDSVGLAPLTELAGTYKGESGGLYGNGRNEPPETHRAAALREAGQIRPLDREGKPSRDGRIALLAIGMSNTTQEFSAFKRMADSDSEKSPAVVLADGAQGGQAAEEWVNDATNRGSGKRVWETVEERLSAAGVTDAQVQAVWLKQALIRPEQYGDFLGHARRLEEDLVKILQLAKRRYPNLRVAYLSSRIYAGYATTPLNPEPYSYESAFAVRWVIQSQIEGKAALNYDPKRGEVRAPLVLWGPYLWADGRKARKSDGFTWERADLAPGDGTHPSLSGRQKVARLLLDFFKKDPTSRSWFVAS